MVVFLLEERSMADFLNVLLPRLFPKLDFLCVPHEGKTDLERRLPGKLRGWRTPGARFVVMRDQDRGDCHAVKTQLRTLCRRGGRPDALIRVVCRELEAWYVGDVDSLADAFPESGGRLRRELRKARYRDPDTVVRPAKALEGLIPDFRKGLCTTALGARLTRQNRSRSYGVFLEGVERLAMEQG